MEEGCSVMLERQMRAAGGMARVGKWGDPMCKGRGLPLQGRKETMLPSENERGQKTGQVGMGAWVWQGTLA